MTANGIDYKSKRWEIKRGKILRRDRLCQQCKRYGKHRAATTAHHCFPAEQYPEFAWCDWNLVGLCSACHNSMHDRDTHKLTALGEQWKRRAEARKPPLKPADA